MAISKSLYRSETNKILGGVAGGLGEYFNIDPNIIRIIFILLTIFSGSGILIYILLWILLPSKSKGAGFETGNIKENLSEMKQKAEKFAHDIRSPGKRQDNKSLLGLLIIIVGFLFLINNLGFNLSIGRFWPLILVALGFVFLTKHEKK